MGLRERLIERLNPKEVHSKEESIERGKALRTSVPRESHALWNPSIDRPDPVDLLRSQGKTRVQALLPLRYERMSASAFTFYRGGALIMASDLSETPTTGIQVQACGHRVVSGQRAIQTASDMLLGWCRLLGEDGKMKDFYVRQLWDGKGSIDLSLLNPAQLEKLAMACGWTLARAHARTGDRFAIAAYLGNSDKFDRAIVEFASSYAYQNELDYQRFMEAYEAGELD